MFKKLAPFRFHQIEENEIGSADFHWNAENFIADQQSAPRTARHNVVTGRLVRVDSSLICSSIFPLFIQKVKHQLAMISLYCSKYLVVRKILSMAN
jgi:hypothetical protein